MNRFAKNTADFFKSHGHKMLSFVIGLAFIALICFAVGMLALRFYRLFVPSDIYTDPGYKGTLYGGSVYEAETDGMPEAGSKEFFERYLANFIMQDMPNFDEPVDLNDKYLISFGIWQAIKLNSEQGVYTYNSKGSFRVPAADVEKFVGYCFDFPEKYDHRTVDVCGRFKYSVFSKTYTVSAASVDSYLVPDVLEVEEGENDTYVLTIDCYEGGLSAGDTPENDPDNFRRRIEVTVQDMGIQGYNSETGSPVPRYTILSSHIVDETESEGQGDIELN